LPIVYNTESYTGSMRMNGNGGNRFGGNVWLQAAYYFGFPAAISFGLSMVLWVMTQAVAVRLEKIEIILESRDTEVFTPLRQQLDRGIASQGQITAKEDGILQEVQKSELQAEAERQSLLAAQDALLRRLDDIYRQDGHDKHTSRWSITRDTRVPPQ
jgi:hypothetical protein